jgi:hypothetical protein
VVQQRIIVITQAPKKNVGTKLPRVGAYISPQLKANLEKLAKKEQRTLSNFIAVVLQRVIDEAKQKGEID